MPAARFYFIAPLGFPQARHSTTSSVPQVRLQLAAEQQRSIGCCVWGHVFNVAALMGNGNTCPFSRYSQLASPRCASRSVLRVADVLSSTLSSDSGAGEEAGEGEDELEAEVQVEKDVWTSQKAQGA